MLRSAKSEDIKPDLIVIEKGLKSIIRIILAFDDFNFIIEESLSYPKWNQPHSILSAQLFITFLLHYR